MRYLLFPEEERILFRHLRKELGLVFVGSSSGEIPRVELGNSDPTTRITDDFPVMYSGQERNYYFWCHHLGPIRKLGDAPETREPKELVMLKLNRDATDTWRDLIDLVRTPIISWVRPKWFRPLPNRIEADRNCLVAGRLESMTTKIKNYPVGLLRIYRQVDRWLRKPAIKVNPFEHCSDTTVSAPRNLSTFWVAAWPKGKEWIDDGGELWPWDS